MAMRTCAHRSLLALPPASRGDPRVPDPARAPDCARQRARGGAGANRQLQPKWPRRFASQRRL